MGVAAGSEGHRLVGSRRGQEEEHWVPCRESVDDTLAVHNTGNVGMAVAAALWKSERGINDRHFLLGADN